VSVRSFLIVGAALALIALLSFGMLKGEPVLAVGDPAPEQRLPLLDGEGDAALSDFRGEWVLVNFWASWCPPCVEESPDIQTFLERHERDGFTVLGIDSRDALEAGRQFARENDLTWNMVRDGDGSLMETYGLTGLPESFLVDPEGRLAAICRGPVDLEGLEALVEPLIEGRQPTAEPPPGCIA
jgi:cytochrome c biogenesis protein CcmG/thiol:disulfide interchange protein DsbE